LTDRRTDPSLWSVWSSLVKI